MIEKQELKSSIKANADIQFMLGVMNEGPMRKHDLMDLQSTIGAYIYMIWVPCRHFLRPYDVNTCGVCGGGRCCDYKLQYDYLGYPHVYKYVEIEDEDDEYYDY